LQSINISGQAEEKAVSNSTSVSQPQQSPSYKEKKMKKRKTEIYKNI
jgi:hypothetical protein